MRALPLLSLLLGSCMTVPVLAANSSPEASEWLSKLAQAEQNQSYQGSFVYERNGSFSSHDIWHRVQDGKVSERLLQLDGAARKSCAWMARCSASVVRWPVIWLAQGHRIRRRGYSIPSN